MTNITYSVNDVPIRLSDERWTHIVENHDDIAGYYFDVLETVTNPTWVLQGDEDERLENDVFAHRADGAFSIHWAGPGGATGHDDRLRFCSGIEFLLLLVLR